MGGRRVEGLKTRMGREHCLGRGGGRLNNGGKKAGGARRTRHSVGRCGTSIRSRYAARRTAPGVRAA